jgi:hypothetical protein
MENKDRMESFFRTLDNLSENTHSLKDNNNPQRTRIRTSFGVHRHLMIWLWANTSANAEDAEIHGGWFLNNESNAIFSFQHVNAQLNEYIWATLQVNGGWESFLYEQKYEFTIQFVLQVLVFFGNEWKIVTSLLKLGNGFIFRTNITKISLIYRT